MNVKELNISTDVSLLLFLHQTDCHKILYYLSIRHMHKVRFRSMHKLSYRHLKIDVYFREL
jgi:hypothetical protein